MTPENYKQLLKELHRVKRIVRKLIGLLITIIIIMPWSAIFLGTQLNWVWGAFSLVFSYYFYRFLKKKKII